MSQQPARITALAALVLVPGFGHVISLFCGCCAADNIDVLVVHPSPTNTRFYEGDKVGMGAVNFFRESTGLGFDW